MVKVINALNGTVLRLLVFNIFYIFFFKHVSRSSTVDVLLSSHISLIFVFFWYDTPKIWPIIWYGYCSTVDILLHVYEFCHDLSAGLTFLLLLYFLLLPQFPRYQVFYYHIMFAYFDWIWMKFQDHWSSGSSQVYLFIVVYSIFTWK